jgi:hypothetical protein
VARAWRRLQNEVQMHWHIHPVNQLREGAGDEVINSLWLWGGDADGSSAQTSYEQIFSRSPVAGLFIAGRDTVGDFSAETAIQAAGKRSLLVLDDLAAPALAGDWASWLTQLHGLESDWFAPILMALKLRRLERVSLILTHNAKLDRFDLTPRSLQKFWVKPSLNRLS